MPFAATRLSLGAQVALMSDDLAGPPRPIAETLTDLVDALERCRARYAIVGAVAMGAHGVRRFTEDIDVLVSEEDLTPVLEATRRTFRELSREPATAQPFQVKLRRPAARGRAAVDVDLMVPVDAAETWALASAVRGRLAGRKVDVACAEAIVLLKLRAYIGDRQSRAGLKHLADAMALLETPGIDVTALRRMVGGFKPLSKALERARSAPAATGRKPTRRTRARRTRR